MHKLTVGFDVAQETFAESFGDMAFKGMASVFGAIIPAEVPTIIHKGSFTKTLQERFNRILILWQHDTNQPVGKPVELYESENGLVLHAKLSNTTLGKESKVLIDDGVLNGLSIGFDIIKEDFSKLADGTRVRNIREIKLYEVSLVTWGMDPRALIGNTYGDITVNGILEERRVNAFKDLPLGPVQEWNAVEAAERVQAWAGSNGSKHHASYLYIDGENIPKLLFCDVVNGKLMAMPTALFSAAAEINKSAPEVGDELDILRLNVERYFAKIQRELYADALVPWAQERFNFADGYEKWMYRYTYGDMGYMIGGYSTYICVDEEGNLTADSIACLKGLRNIIDAMLSGVKPAESPEALTEDAKDEEKVDYSALDAVELAFADMILENVKP